MTRWGIGSRLRAQTLIVMTAVPFAAVGAIWTLWIAGFNTSIAVWVGMIALLGVAAETASVMVIYLDEAWSEGQAAGTVTTVPELVTHSLDTATLRVRPMLMTAMANIVRRLAQLPASPGSARPALRRYGSGLFAPSPIGYRPQQATGRGVAQTLLAEV